VRSKFDPNLWDQYLVRTNKLRCKKREKRLKEKDLFWPSYFVLF
jgi:hypothetical protein